MKGVFLDERPAIPAVLLPFTTGGEELIPIARVYDCLQVLQRENVDFIIVYTGLIRKMEEATFTEFMETTFYFPKVFVGTMGELPEEWLETLERSVFLQFAREDYSIVKAAVQNAIMKKDLAVNLQASCFRMRILNLLGE